MSEFAAYATHGWKLCPINPGLKGPTAKSWNAPERMITHPLAAAQLEAAGLCHAYSGTCAIDIDDMRQASLWLAERGVSLSALLEAPDAVQIKSPASNHGKLIYRTLIPLPSKKIVIDKQNIIDFRCGTANGLTVQDVLPPSPHPDKQGNIDGIYEWIGDWRKLPELPAALFDIWVKLTAAESAAEAEPQQAREVLHAMLKRLSPDMSRDEWVKVGLGIHHEYGGSAEGMQLWDAWSRQSKKYIGTDIEPCWRSFTAGGGITGNSLVTMIDASADDMLDASAMAVAVAAVSATDATASSEDELVYPDTLLAPHDSPPFLVDRLLERGAEASLIGPSKSYKSLWADQLAVCVATGTPFFGRTTEQGLVLVLVGEGAGGIRHRLQAIRHGMKLDFTDAPLAVLPRPFALPTEAGVKRLRRAIAAAEKRYNRKLALLIIDTFGRYGNGEENAAEDLYAFFRAVSSCRGSAALLVVHHTGHSDATRGRGTSAWDQAVDTEFVASIRADTNTRSIENTKQKDGEPCAPMHFTLRQIKTDSTRVGEPVYSVILEPTVAEAPQKKLSPNEQIVFDEVVLASGATQDEILDAAIAKLPADGADKRRESLKRAFVGLVSKHAVIVRGDRIYKADDIAAEMAELIGQ